MFCNKCGNYFDDKTESRFCSKCGNDLSKMREAGKAEEVVEPQEPKVKQRVLTKEQYRENGNKLRLAIILSCIAGVILAGLLMIFAVVIPIVNFVGDTVDKANDLLDSKPNLDIEDNLPINWNSGEDEEEENGSDSEENNEVETRRVGSEKYGYVSIPTTWIKNNYYDDMIQYMSFDNYMLTMHGLYVDSKEYADIVEEGCKEQGIEDVSVENVDIGEYKDCYLIKGEQKSTGVYLCIWLIDGDDGFTHYIAVEGKDKNNEYFTEIIKTFAKDK